MRVLAERLRMLSVVQFEHSDYDEDLVVMAAMPFPEYISNLKRGSAGFSR